MKNLAEFEYPWDLKGLKIKNNQFVICGTVLSKWEELINSITYYKCLVLIDNSQLVICMIEKSDMFNKMNDYDKNSEIAFYGYISYKENRLFLHVTNLMNLSKQIKK